MATASRYHHLDALRAFAMLLGIVVHALLSFAGFLFWPVQDIHQNAAVYGFVLYAILLVLYEFAVRYTLVGTMLNGRKVRIPKLPNQS